MQTSEVKIRYHTIVQNKRYTGLVWWKLQSVDEKIDNLSKWRNISCSKSANSLEIGTQFNNYYQNDNRVFVDIGKIILNFAWKDKWTRIAKTKFKE